jgi:hypothetical protein
VSCSGGCSEGKNLRSRKIGGEKWAAFVAADCCCQFGLE